MNKSKKPENSRAIAAWKPFQKVTQAEMKATDSQPADLKRPASLHIPARQ
jgi:hypothetical protein